MSITFGWWHKDPVEGKYQINAEVHGGNIEWSRHQGHHTSWIPHTPSDEDRERLVYEAEKRVPRRLMSPKQFDELKRLRAAAEDGDTPKPLKRGAHLKRARDLPEKPAP